MPRIKMDVASYAVLAVATLVLAFAGLHGFHNKSITITAFGIGAILVVIGVCLYWQDAVWKHDERLTTGTKLENASPSPLVKPAPQQAEIPTPVIPQPNTEAPQASPSPLPPTPDDIEKRLENAEKHGKKEDAWRALDGTYIDWTLHFFTAKRLPNHKILVGFGFGPKERSGLARLVSVVLPLGGNEYLLTSVTLYVFRIRGEIDAKGSDPIQIRLRNAKLEYVRSDPDTGAASTPKQSEVESRPNIPLDSSTTDLTPRQIRDRILSAPNRDAALSALEGLSVDWTLLLVEARSADRERLFLVFRDGESAEEDATGAVMVSCSVPTKPHKRLPLAAKGSRFNVKGTISPMGAFDMRLENVSIQLLS
jgi:hypothetical protein